MLKKAMLKLESEITAAGKDDEYTPFVGSQLMDHIRLNPNDAVLILADNRTIKGSLKAVGDEAEKKKKQGTVMFTPNQGMEIILKYFGINTNEPKTTAAAVTNFNVSLDDIL
jgi:hypothetical protein